MPKVTDTLKDTGYVLLGLGVIGFQRAQVRRHELSQELDARTKDVEAQLAEVRAQFAKLAKTVEERFEPVLAELEGRLDEIEDRLPEQVADLVKQARTTARELAREAQVRLNSGNGVAAA